MVGAAASRCLMGLSEAQINRRFPVSQSPSSRAQLSPPHPSLALSTALTLPRLSQETVGVTESWGGPKGRLALYSPGRGMLGFLQAAGGDKCCCPVAFTCINPLCPPQPWARMPSRLQMRMLSEVAEKADTSVGQLQCSVWFRLARATRPGHGRMITI